MMASKISNLHSRDAHIYMKYTFDSVYYILYNTTKNVCDEFYKNRIQKKPSSKF